jgi:hypothetical protein
MNVILPDLHAYFPRGISRKYELRVKVNVHSLLPLRSPRGINGKYELKAQVHIYSSCFTYYSTVGNKQVVRSESASGYLFILLYFFLP